MTDDKYPEKRKRGRPRTRVQPERPRIDILREQQEAYRAQVETLYLSGLSLAQVAMRLGCTKQAVASLLKRQGTVMRPAGGNTGSHSRHRK